MRSISSFQSAETHFVVYIAAMLERPLSDAQLGTPYSRFGSRLAGPVSGPDAPKPLSSLGIPGTWRLQPAVAAEAGKTTVYEDVFTKIEVCRRHIVETSLGANYADQFVC